MLTNDGFLPPSDSLVGQVSQTIRAGLPLESALRALAAQSTSSRMRMALTKLSHSLENGMPLEQAFKESKTTLPDSLKSLIAVGIETGRMDSVMRYCVERSQRAVSLQQYVWLSLSYPLFLVWMALSICSLIALNVVPMAKQIFDDFGTELPSITEVVINITDLLYQFGWFSQFLIPVGGLLLWCLFIMAGVKGWGTKYTASIPVIGRIFQYAALSEFCELVAFLVECDVPFSRVVVTAGNSTENRWLRKKCRQIADDIDQGISPSEAARVCYLPNSLVHAFREVNSRQHFVATMHGLREIFASQAQVTAQVVSLMLANISIGCVVSFALMVGICIFAPLIKLLNDLS